MRSATTSLSSSGTFSCFFLEDLQQGYTLPIYFFVLSIKARAQMDVGRTSKNHDKRQEYEECYNIIVQPRGAPGVFLGDLQQGYTFPVHYFVLSIRVGAQKDVGRTFKDHDERQDHKVEKTSDYDLCFNNHFLVVEGKKVVWELDV